MAFGIETAGKIKSDVNNVKAFYDIIMRKYNALNFSSSNGNSTASATGTTIPEFELEVCISIAKSQQTSLRKVVSGVIKLSLDPSGLKVAIEKERSIF